MTDKPESDDESLPSPVMPGARITPTRGGYKIRLPNGTELSIEEWVSGDLRSAFVIDPRCEVKYDWRLFDYGRGQIVPGTSREIEPRSYHAESATFAHTNVPRSSGMGLPMDWEMYVTSWRAQTNARLDDEMVEWASLTSTELLYNMKTYGSSTMLDLLMAPQPIGDPLPLQMREHLIYSVDVRSPADATDRLRRSLCGLSDRIQKAVGLIDGMMLGAPYRSGNVGNAGLDAVRSLLTEQRPITIWVHLQGVLRRAVM